MKITSLLFTLLLSLSFASCSTQDKSNETLVLSENGLNSLDANTTLNLKNIQSHFPTLELKQLQGSTEGEAYPLIKAYENKKEIFSITFSDENLFSIIIISNRVNNASNVKIGDTFSHIFAKSTPKCYPGSEEMSGLVICKKIGSKHIWYTFEVNFNGPDGVVPPNNILQKGILKQIVWSR